MKFEGREEVMLAAIDPGSGYQRSDFEVELCFAIRRQREQVNDKVNDVLGNVHRFGI